MNKPTLFVEFFDKYKKICFSILQIINKQGRGVFFTITGLRSHFRISSAKTPETGVFREEPFHRASDRFSFVPSSEFLFDHSNCEDFFADVRSQSLTQRTDLVLFREAIRKAQNEGIESFSFNIDLLSAFDPNFAKEASLVCFEEGFENKSAIFFEITEHSDFPEGADPKVLHAFGEQGFRLAVDDFIPFNPREVERLGVLAPYASMIKFDHSVVDRYLQGERSEMLDLVARYRAEYPSHIMVIEGVSLKKLEESPALVKDFSRAGIDLIQEYTPRAKDPVFSYKAIPAAKQGSLLQRACA